MKGKRSPFYTDGRNLSISFESGVCFFASILHTHSEFLRC